MISDSQKWFWLATLVLTGALLYLLAPILSPFLFACLLAYLGDPLVDRLEGRGLSRTAATTVVVLLLGVLVVLLPVLLLPVLGPQLRALVANLPKLVDWITGDLLPWANAAFDLTLALPDAEVIKSAFAGHVGEVGSAAAALAKYISRSGLAFAGWLASMVLVPVVTFYMLRDWDHFVRGIHDLLPRHVEPTVSSLAGESDVVLGAFLRGQLSVMLGLAALYSAGLSLVGLESALAIGLLAGLVSFVPYLGVIVGMLTALLAVLVQGPEWAPIIGVLVVFGAGQLLEGMVLTPWLVGDRIGLHPVTVIFAVLAGGQLFGFLGILLALPVAAVLAVILRHARERYRESDLYDAAGDDPVRPGGESTAGEEPGQDPDRPA